MGRSRAPPHSSDALDLSQRGGKRKKTSQNVDTVEDATVAGHGTSHANNALYHCNYCNKDISGQVRIKCVRCSDFDLCVECFSVGAEVKPHKSNHPYRVMDNLSFPLICSDWNADEEILLLEAVEMYGLGNWGEVAEHVGTKSKLKCIDHYNSIYMNSPCFPLPDMSHVMGKSREELLAMRKHRDESPKGLHTIEGVVVKDEGSFSERIKVEDSTKEPPALNSSPCTSPGSRDGPSGAVKSLGASKRAPGIVQSKDSVGVIKVEDGSIGEKKPKISTDEQLNSTELCGYNPKRQEFDIEYDNDAEQLLADMEFKETDTDAERELKLRVLRAYSVRLDERKRRKDFIIKRNLLPPGSLEKNLNQEGKEICQQYRVFLRFHSNEQHEELLRSLIEEELILKRIQDLQDARAAGCRTSADAERFVAKKRKLESNGNGIEVKENHPTGSGGKSMHRVTHSSDKDQSPGVQTGTPIASEHGLKDVSLTKSEVLISNNIDKWDVRGFLGAELLSETEKQLCGEIRILPTHYLLMAQTLSKGISDGNITKKADAHGLFKVDPSKIDKIYDMVLEKGNTQP